MVVHKLTHTYAGREYHYTVKLKHWLPKWTPWHEGAITLGSTIYVLRGTLSAGLHAHEFRHVVQWHRYGGIPMAAYYLRGLLNRGYPNSWAEVAATAYSLAHSAEFTDL